MVGFVVEGHNYFYTCYNRTTVYARIQTQGFISFLTPESWTGLLQNEAGLYLRSTVLASGSMSTHSARHGLTMHNNTFVAAAS